jgi:uncharacterized protein YpiB (UPF0302 family)
MRNTISATDKKHFIQWFLEHYELKHPEAQWLLQYLCGSEAMLGRVHFTDHFKNASKCMVISTTCVQMTAFRFYKNKRVTSDVERAFLDVHSHPDEDLYITLYFRDRTSSSEYRAIIEDGDASSQEPGESDLTTRLVVELIVDHIERLQRIASLQRAVDVALDRRDRASFERLAGEYARAKSDDL